MRRIPEPTTAFDVALQLIEPYVLRGDSIQSLRAGQQTAWCGSWKAQIGGYFHKGPLAHKKRFSPDYILVQMVNDTCCTEVFRLADIYAHIKHAERQLALAL